MRLVFAGDVVGKAGRNAIKKFLPMVQEKLNPDCIVINAENAAHGFGITEKNYWEFRNQGVDIITLGNHSFDKEDIFSLLQTDAPIVRPLNLPENTIGTGFYIKELAGGKKIAVVQLLGKLFMKSVADPFGAIENWLQEYRVGKDYDVLLVDFHAEATAEKMSMGFFLDGRATLVAGTHTHIPTADAMILPAGTGYITDVGMCGDYHSVIGMQVKEAIARFINAGEKGYLKPAETNSTFCAVVVDTEENSLCAKNIFPIRLGDFLQNTVW